MNELIDSLPNYETKCPQGHVVKVGWRDTDCPLVSTGMSYALMNGKKVEGDKLDQVESVEGFGYPCTSCGMLYWIAKFGDTPKHVSPAQFIGLFLAMAIPHDQMTIAQSKIAQLSLIRTADKIVGEVTRRGLLDRKLQGESHAREAAANDRDQGDPGTSDRGDVRGSRPPGDVPPPDDPRPRRRRLPSDDTGF